MDPQVESKMTDLLVVLKYALGQYAISKYENAYGSEYLQTMQQNIRNVKIKSTDKDNILSALDTQACLDLLLKQKSIFWEDLKHIGFAYISELMDFRIQLAHEIPITNQDAFRAADTVRKVLELIEADSDFRIQSYDITSDILSNISKNDHKNRKSYNFSNELKENTKELNKVLTSLTKDQYKIIEWLRGYNKAVIQGCAGSGKTLVAAEKAIRLAKAGLSTLILCHNFYLAEYFEKLVIGANVDVYDFVNWINFINGKKVVSPDNWTHYEEPTQEAIDLAFDNLSMFEHKYDAIIIDEGQDFRDTWWIIVEYSLKNSENGILYIFADDNQSLLPRKLNYPVPAAPYNLSKNCRNAGNIFEIIQKLHPQAPEMSLFLENKGVLNIATFSKKDRLEIFNEALVSTLGECDYKNIVVLTSEFEPNNNSILNNYQIQDKPGFLWQNAVRKYLQKLLNEYSDKLSKTASLDEFKIPSLTTMTAPTEEDIGVVSKFARSIGKSLFKKWEGATIQKDIHWKMSQNGIYLTKESPYSLLNYFSLESWASILPRIPKVCVCSDVETIDDQHLLPIQLQTISLFKGLESDAIILYIGSPRQDLENILYVGISRARYVLYIVIDQEAFNQVSSLHSFNVDSH